MSQEVSLGGNSGGAAPTSATRDVTLLRRPRIRTKCIKLLATNRIANNYLLFRRPPQNSVTNPVASNEVSMGSGTI